MAHVINVLKGAKKKSTQQKRITMTKTNHQLTIFDKYEEIKFALETLERYKDRQWRVVKQGSYAAVFVECNHSVCNRLSKYNQEEASSGNDLRCV